MSDQPICPKCGSSHLIPQVRLVDYFSANPDGKDSLKAEVHENPDAWLYKGTKQASVRANICGQCGFAELFVKNPQELWEAYRKQKG